jgi:hypothetical protein
MLEALLNTRQVIEAKHDAYTDRLNEERMSNFSVDTLRSFVQELSVPGSGVTKQEMRQVKMLLYYGGDVKFLTTL